MVLFYDSPVIGFVIIAHAPPLRCTHNGVFAIYAYHCSIHVQVSMCEVNNRKCNNEDTAEE